MAIQKKPKGENLSQTTRAVRQTFVCSNGTPDDQIMNDMEAAGGVQLSHALRQKIMEAWQRYGEQSAMYRNSPPRVAVENELKKVEKCLDKLIYFCGHEECQARARVQETMDATFRGCSFVIEDFAAPLIKLRRGVIKFMEENRPSSGHPANEPTRDFEKMLCIIYYQALNGKRIVSENLYKFVKVLLPKLGQEGTGKSRLYKVFQRVRVTQPLRMSPAVK